MKAQPFFLAIFFAIASSSHAQTTDQSTASNSTSAPDSSVIEASNTVAPKPQFGSLGEIQTAKKAALAERCVSWDMSGVTDALVSVPIFALTLGLSAVVALITRPAMEHHDKDCEKKVQDEYDAYVAEYNAKQEQERLTKKAEEAKRCEQINAHNSAIEKVINDCIGKGVPNRAWRSGEFDALQKRCTDSAPAKLVSC